MTYKLTFLKQAAKEWKKLPPVIKEQFNKKLKERLVNPVVPACALREMKDCYKIKLKTVGYRLIYEVHNDRIVVQVIAIGKRDKDDVYKKALTRNTIH